jgi:hypothetical protein
MSLASKTPLLKIGGLALVTAGSLLGYSWMRLKKRANADWSLYRELEVPSNWEEDCAETLRNAADGRFDEEGTSGPNRDDELSLFR